MDTKLMIYNSIVGSIFCRLEGDTLTGLSIGVNNFQGIQDKTIVSRVVGRSHFEGLKLKDVEGYLKHHLEIAGIAEGIPFPLFKIICKTRCIVQNNLQILVKIM